MQQADMHLSFSLSWDVCHMEVLHQEEGKRYADAKCWRGGLPLVDLTEWNSREKQLPLCITIRSNGSGDCDAWKIIICVWLGLEPKMARARKGLFHYTSHYAILSVKHLCNQASAEALQWHSSMWWQVCLSHIKSPHTHIHTRELQALVLMLCVAQTTLHHSNAINVQMKSQPRSCASQRLSIDSAWVLVLRRWAGINDSLQEQSILLLKLIDLLL